jgi:hypothetical protein
MSAIDIHKDTEATLGPYANRHPTVTKDLRETRVTHGNERTPISIEDECQKLIDKVVLLALADESFASFRQTAPKKLIPMTRVYPHLIGPLCMTVKHLRCAPHRLSSQQKGIRVQKAQGLLTVLKSAKHNSWKSIITPDTALNRCGFPETKNQKLESAI